MLSLKSWLVPRIAFWVMWTSWLCCLQYFLLDRFRHTPESARMLLVIGPPLLLTWIGARMVKNGFDTASGLFWKGAAASCLVALFASFDVVDAPNGAIGAMIGFLLCGYMVVRGAGTKRKDVKQGELLQRTQVIALRMGVSVNRILVFTTPRNTPSAFAHRMGAIMLSDSLLRMLSRNEADAVIAHEAAHLRSSQRITLAIVPILVLAAASLRLFWPAAAKSAPFWPILFLLLWRALRRMLEFDADAAAVRITGDPESLITALTRLSHAGGLPMHWGGLAGLFMSHPPMTARFRSIARHSGIAEPRIGELISIGTATPGLPGYTSPFDQPDSAEHAVLSNHRDRLNRRLAPLAKVFPIAAGVAASALVCAWASDGVTLLTLTAASILAGIVLYCVAYEVLVGQERRRLRDQIADDARGYFVGISTADEPRIFDGSYHYDLGIANIADGRLDFKGARCSFSLDSSQVRRVWMADGPPHFTPRKVVCVQYRIDDGEAIVSLQSMDRWFWPWNAKAAQELYELLSRWSEDATVASHCSAQPRSAQPPPQVAGAIVPRLPLSSVWKGMRVSCLISWAGGAMVWSFLPGASWWLIGPFVAPIVSGALMLFLLSPHLGRKSTVRPHAVREHAGSSQAAQ
jgi:heat shock protein HtpX